MTKHKKRLAAASWVGAGCTVLLLLILSSLSPLAAAGVNKAIASAGAVCINTLFNKTLVPSAGMIIASGRLLSLCIYALLVLLVWNALRMTKLSKGKVRLGSFVVGVLAVGVEMLYRTAVSGRQPAGVNFAVGFAGVVLTLGCIVAWQWLWVKYPRVCNWETVSYVIAGVLTTLVNMAVFGVLFTNYGIGTFLSNTIAWVVAVLFAYVVNKLFVFHSHNETKRQALREFGLFIAARLFSLAVDDAGIVLLIDVLHVNSGVAKILTNIIVMIMNYFFSKLIIFKNGVAAED